MSTQSHFNYGSGSSEIHRRAADQRPVVSNSQSGLRSFSWKVSRKKKLCLLISEVANTKIYYYFNKREGNKTVNDNMVINSLIPWDESYSVSE